MTMQPNPDTETQPTIDGQETTTQEALEALSCAIEDCLGAGVSQQVISKYVTTALEDAAGATPVSVDPEFILHAYEQVKTRDGIAYTSSEISALGLLFAQTNGLNPQLTNGGYMVLAALAIAHKKINPPLHINDILGVLESDRFSEALIGLHKPIDPMSVHFHLRQLVLKGIVIITPNGGYALATREHYTSGQYSLEDLEQAGISLKTARALIRAGISTWDTLTRYAEAGYLRHIPQIGKTRAEEIKEALRRRNKPKE